MLPARFAFLSLVVGIIGFVNASPVVKMESDTTLPTPAPPCIQPDLSDDPTKWSTRHFIRKHLSTPNAPTRIFWTGLHNGISIQSKAVDCAAKTPGGAVTIGMLMCQLGGFTMPSSSTPAGNALWAYASEVYAEHTKGAAYTVVGDALVTSIWFDVEFPTLRENTGVKSLISLDPESCGKKCYWVCPNPKDCKGLKPCVIETIPP